MATTQSNSTLTTQNSKEKDLNGRPAKAHSAEGLSLPDSTTVHPDTAAAQPSDTALPPHHDVPNGKVTVSEPPVAAESGQVPSQSHSTTQLSPTEAPQTTTSPPTVSLPLSHPVKERSEDSDKKDAEKDKASLNTTLTGTQTHTQTQSSPSRQKETKSLSDVAHSNGASSSAEASSSPVKSANKKARSSLFSRLFQVLVPCVGPSKRAHDLDPLPVPTAPAVQGEAATPLKEKQAAKEAEDLPPKPSVSSDAPAPPTAEEKPQQMAEHSEAPVPLHPVPERPETPAPLYPIEVPDPSEDPSVVVPPTPTKLLPREETEGLTSGAVVPPGATGHEHQDSSHDHHTHIQDSENESDGSTSLTDEESDEEAQMDEIEDEEERLIMQGGAGIPIGLDGLPKPLLPPLAPKHAGRKCLVLDLDETLVHSSFKSISQADYVVPVEIEYHWHNVYVIKRPGVDNFLKKMGEIYEVVVFTASLSKYADPVLDKLDIHHVVSHRLFRESCYNHRGNYVKDLSSWDDDIGYYYYR
ncbi:hypothetical protein EUX98_g896 [Antrodiella citrinella]|uniref:Mitochondrial import inner membrane translocase subunit TIM50 n=1 Tax=Antrodiella citrinella TaxID=2447956 RepID=A0A4S4N2P6_9APHY|nr:hypothetical protein EUX98_g896 [Antrodiella citrinella]